MRYNAAAGAWPSTFNNKHGFTDQEAGGTISTQSEEGNVEDLILPYTVWETSYVLLRVKYDPAYQPEYKTYQQK